MVTRANWYYFVSSVGFNHSQASTCKTCKGACYVYSLNNLPRRWNPEWIIKPFEQKSWLTYRLEPKFKRRREAEKNYLDRARYRA